MKNFSLLLLKWCCLVCSLSPIFVDASALDDELQATIAAYRNAGPNPREVLRPLKWSGITDPALFDIVETDLLNNMSQRGQDWTEGNAWRVQSLAYSGNPKYRETIAAIIEKGRSSKLRRHAKSSLAVMEDFASYNPTISAGLDDVPAERLVKQRIINMLTSDNYELIRAGASQIYHHHFDDQELINLSEQRIKDLYTKVHQRFPDGDALGWLCKVLAKTKDEKYIPLLREVAKNTPEKALQRHAKNAVKDIKGIPEVGPHGDLL